MSELRASDDGHRRGAGTAGQDPLDRLYVLRRRWWVVVPFTLAGCVLGSLAAVGERPSYRAEATVQRKAERSPLEIPLSTQGPGDMISELEVIGSSAVLGVVVDSLGSEPFGASTHLAARLHLRNTLKLNIFPNTSIVRISFHHPDPAVAAAVVNITAATYRDYSAQKARAEATRRREFLAEQLGSVADSVQVAQAALVAHQMASGTLDPAGHGGAVAEALMTAEAELRALRFQEATLAGLSNGMRNGTRIDDALRRAIVMGREFVPALPDLYSRLQQLEIEKSKLTASRYGFTKNEPQVQVLDSAMAQTRAEIRSMIDQSHTAVRVRQQATAARVAELQAQKGTLPQTANVYARLKQRSDAIQRTFDELASKYYEAQIVEAVEGGNVEIVERAAVPTEPLPMRGPRLLFFAVVLGTGVGVAAAFGVEYVDRRVRTPAEAERITGLRVIGMIPSMDVQGSASQSDPFADGRGAVPEAFRMLRTELHFSRIPRPRVVAITSAAPGEGKSLVAANLAAALAREESSRVLLIDADMRRPVVHRVFGTPRGPGLSDAIHDQSALAAVVAIERMPGLDVLSAGSEVFNPAELLASGAFGALIDRLRGDYDYVIVDTPPVLAVTDAVNVGSHVDGLVVVVRAEQTDRFALARAVDSLRPAAAPLLGCVLNAVPSVGRFGRYSSSYGYYGSTYTQYYEGAAAGTASHAMPANRA